MSCATQDIVIQKGKTFQRVIRWETSPYVYKAITAITKAAPAVVTATGHALPDGWRAAVVSVQGMTEINAENNPPKASEFHKVTYVDADSVSINDINSAEYTAYTSGGYLQYMTPVDLAGYSARMQFRPSAEDTATPLLDLVSPTNIVLDNAAKTITVTIAASVTEDITWTEAVYELEVEDGSGVVTQLLRGNVSVITEVTK
jgi:hypothetical protein